MTEAEAKTKRCCGGAASHPQHDGMCTAAECMAWRALPQKGVVTPKLEERAAFTADDPSAYEAVPHAWDVVRLPLEGFCGLAGRPE